MLHQFMDILWMTFLNNLHLDLDIQEENCVNPDISYGFQIHKHTPTNSETFWRICLLMPCGHLLGKG